MFEKFVPSLQSSHARTARTTNVLGTEVQSPRSKISAEAAAEILSQDFGGTVTNAETAAEKSSMQAP